MRNVHTGTGAEGCGVASKNGQQGALYLQVEQEDEDKGAIGMRKITIEVDEAKLKEFMDNHHGWEPEDDMKYSDEEIEQAIKDEIGCLI